MKRLTASLLSLFCVLTLAVLSIVGTAAAEKIDLNKTASLKINYACENVKFSIYRIADVSDKGTYSLIGEFSDYPITLDLASQDDLNSAADTFSAYIDKDGIKPTASADTDSNNTASFSDLKLGLYLVKWSEHTYNYRRFIPKPFIAALPANTNGEWNYILEAEPKYQTDDITVYVSRRVHKVWNDNNSSARPESVEVQLLQNGKVYETVSLNAKNSWSYQWDKLDASSEWNIVENKVADGYTVRSSREGITFVLTNTKPDTQTPTTPTTPTAPSAATPTQTGKTTTSGKLPQTGMPWLPVPILAFLGAVIFGAGWILYRRSR